MTARLPAARSTLAARLRESAFCGTPRGGAPRIGAEVELIPLDTASCCVAPVSERLMPMLRVHGAANGWTERSSAKGAPRFVLPHGGAVTLEPGGQLEYATPPFPTPGALLADLDAVLEPLVDAGAAAGLTLASAGIDPHNAIDVVPLQLDSPRYRAMDAYLARIGPAGAVMMRQTASIQINVDVPSDPITTWRVLNAAAPFLTAIFANSARYAGRDTGHASYRAWVWRLLDPARTGIFRCTDDPAAEYADLALRAPVIAMRTAEGQHHSLEEWMMRTDLNTDDVDEHLSTLFPEVRPKGYFEVRSIDTIPVRWLPAPILLLAGMILDDASVNACAELLGAPDPGLLVCAGTLGLGEPRIRAVAMPLIELAMKACERKGDAFCSAEQRERAAQFFERFTQRDRSPGS